MARRPDPGNWRMLSRGVRVDNTRREAYKGRVPTEAGGFFPSCTGAGAPLAGSDAADFRGRGEAVGPGGGGRMTSVIARLLVGVIVLAAAVPILLAFLAAVVVVPWHVAVVLLGCLCDE